MSTNISNVMEITKLAAIRDKLIKALAAAPKFKEEIQKSVDNTAPENFNVGHNMFMQKYSSGGAPSWDLSGCYVGVESIDAVVDALNARKLEVEARLLVLGVHSVATTHPLDFGADVEKQVNQPRFVKLPVGGSGSALTYVSSDPSIASVDKIHGAVTLNSVGTVTITASESDTSTTATYTLIVHDNMAASTIPVLTADSADFTVVMSNGSGTFTFVSSDESVFTVNRNTGVVDTIGVGTANLTITDVNTQSELSVSVRVYGTVTIGGDVAKLVTDDNFVQAAGDGSGSYSYESSDPEVATVDDQGEVDILAAGTTTITATDLVTNKTASYELTVTE